MAALAAATSGWSKGLMPSAAPHSAVATSHSSTWAPRRRTARRAQARPPGGRRRPGRRAPAAAWRLADGDEQPVVAVDRGRPERLADDRHDAGAVLAGGLGEQLLEPQPEGGDCSGRGRRSACRGPPAPPAASDAASRAAGLAAGGVGRSASVHGRRRCQQRRDVDAGERRRHQPEERQRRVAPADVGRVLEDRSEPALRGQRGRARSRGR